MVHIRSSTSGIEHRLSLPFFLSINHTIGTMGLLNGLINLSLAICIGAECKNPVPARNIVGGAPQVTLSQATVEGFLDVHNNSVFLGIPFADTTGGQNR